MLRLKEENEKVIPIPNDNKVINPETPDADTVKNAWSFSVNDLVESTWTLIGDINSVISSLDANETADVKKDDIQSILNGVVDELTISVGMLNKAATLIDGTKKDLMDAGEEKANAIINNNENPSEK